MDNLPIVTSTAHKIIIIIQFFEFQLNLAVCTINNVRL